MKKEQIVIKLKRYEEMYSGDMETLLRDVRLFIIDESEQLSETEEKLKVAFKNSDSLRKDNNGVWSDWGCCIYDNEDQSRKAFG